MYEKQTVRLNYCEIHEQISSKTFLKNMHRKLKKWFFEQF